MIVIKRLFIKKVIKVTNITDIRKKPPKKEVEINKIKIKMDAIFENLPENKLSLEEFSAVEGVLHRALYEIETSGDEADIRFANDAIKLSQFLIRKK